MSDKEAGLTIGSHSNWNQSYIDAAQSFNVPIAEAVARSSWDLFCNQDVPPTVFGGPLERFARKIDGLTKSDWIKTEDRIANGQANGTFDSFDRHMPQLVRKTKDKEELDLIDYAFRTAGQISYVTNYFGVDSDYPGIDLLESPRLAQATANAALEVYLRKELDKYGYGFDHVTALVGYQGAKELLADTNFEAWDRIKASALAINQEAKRTVALKRVEIAAGLALVPPFAYEAINHPVESMAAATLLFFAGIGYKLLSGNPEQHTRQDVRDAIVLDLTI